MRPALVAGPSVREPVPAGHVRRALQGALRLLQRRPLRPRQRQVPLPPGLRGTQGEGDGDLPTKSAMHTYDSHVTHVTHMRVLLFILLLFHQQKMGHTHVMCPLHHTDKMNLFPFQCQEQCPYGRYGLDCDQGRLSDSDGLLNEPSRKRSG